MKTSAKRKPARKTRLFAFWCQDVGGDWILHCDTNVRCLESKRAELERRSYRCTTITEFRALHTIGEDKA